MTCERIKLEDLLQSGGLGRLADEIRCGAVFVYPTETIYGIGGNALLPEVNERIFNIKNRPAENPMIHLASKLDIFTSMEIDLPPAAKCLADAFWPGLLTMVLPAKKNDNTVAIRVSDHQFVKRLFDFISVPIFSTSANISGEKYNPDPDYIYSTFSLKIDFMIDGGFLPPSPPSTVVKIDKDNNCTMIREGVVSRSTLSDILGKNGFTLSF